MLVEGLNHNVKADVAKLKGKQLGISCKVEEKRMNARGQNSEKIF